MNRQFRQGTVAAAACALTLIAMFCMFVWGMHRGFDLFDEGLALYSAQFPNDTHFISSLGFFLRLCPNIWIDQIRSLRLVHLLSRFLGAGILALGYFSWLRTYCPSIEFTRQQRLAIYCFTGIGSFLTFAILQQTINYNGIVSFFSSVAIGVLLFGLTRNHQFATFCTFICGGLIALSFFCKFSSSVAVLAVVCVFLSFHGGRVALLFCGLVFGLASGAAAYFGCIQNFSQWSEIFSNQLNILLNSSYSPSSVSLHSFQSAGKHIPEIIALTVVGAAVGITSFIFRKSISARLAPSIVWLPALICMLLLVGASLTFKGVIHTSVLYTLLIPIFIGASMCALKIVKNDSFPKSEGLRLVQGSTLLMVLPLALSVGTDTPILWHALCNFTSMYLAVGVGYVAIGQFYRLPLFFDWALSIAALTTLEIFVNGYIFAPHSKGSLLTQNVPTYTQTLRGLMLDASTHDYLVNTEKMLSQNGFVPGDPLLTLYYKVGVAYAVQARIPQGPWYGETLQEKGQIQWRLRSLTPEDSLHTFILVTTCDSRKEPDRSVVYELEQKGIRLGQNFVLVGKIQCPKSKGLPDMYSYLYAPKGVHDNIEHH